ncbi:EAL domain-containing protein [Bradyrhizobium semiaridum]|uniref:EAL domain-containing protein n=1 Tax=Bradyrhizobium semiaridum TaxID=2821404 RepID=UPI001CE25C05
MANYAAFDARAAKPVSSASISAAGLGRSLKITTTAEGVETVDQLDWLRAEGCNEVQGFLFSAARPEIARTIARQSERRARSFTKERSILILSNGKLRR